MSKQVQEAYIVAATRTPIGRSGRGYFRNTRPDDLLVAAVRSALAQVPASRYEIAETLAEYSTASGATDDFLEIVLQRIESRYALPGFATAFTADFEAFLRSADAEASHERCW